MYLVPMRARGFLVAAAIAVAMASAYFGLLVDLPVRYRDRTYGTTNIHRFRHGLLLLRMVVFAAGRIKFV